MRANCTTSAEFHTHRKKCHIPTLCLFYSGVLRITTLVLLSSLFSQVVKGAPVPEREQEAMLNSFLNDLKNTSYTFPAIDVEKIKEVHVGSNRLNVPWYLPKRAKFPTLEESRYRILYSPLKALASDGVGHNFAVMNAEIGAAFRFGLTYTHRLSSFGSLTRDDPSAVENFFGWGHNQIPRDFIHESFCETSFQEKTELCRVCESVKVNKSLSNMQFRRIVEIPRNLTYRRNVCTRAGGAIHGKECKKERNDFIKKNNHSFTLFQMPVKTCANNPIDSYIDPLARAYLFHNYWDRQAQRYASERSADAVGLEGEYVMREGIPRLQARDGRGSVEYPENSLNIAIHARRGDFFKEKHRQMVSTEVFGHVVRNMMQIVQRRGSVFSRMPVVIHVYSEGIFQSGVKNGGHDISRMIKSYRDSDGSIRSPTWVTTALRGKGKFEIDATPQTGARQKVMTTQPLFPQGLRVQFHIAQDTLTSLHEMISADIFIGSASGLSQHVVSTMSRGIYLLPLRLQAMNLECCQVAFNSTTGALGDVDNVEKFWDAFVSGNQGSAARAYYSRRSRS